jgi:hypothetical protein
MMMPGWARHAGFPRIAGLGESPVLELERVITPMCQTLPCLSCAYQSKVRSIGFRVRRPHRGRPWK